MSNNLGPQVSRVLDPEGRSFLEVILAQGRPPLDAEFNLLQELATGASRQIVLRGMPSGWLGNETNTSASFGTDSTWSNWFKFGAQRAGEQRTVAWAAVNGWLIPVTGTRTGTPPGSPDDGDTFNVIALDPPPSNSGDFRTDFVFLEVWLARVPPTPSALNKPSASTIWRYGNVEGGFSFLPDDLVDPAIGFETSQRVQLQYRLRVVKGLVGLTSSPDGFDATVVKAQGAASAPTSYVFTNMRQALGDPGLWRAGDGTANTLGTVDGYSYAIPVCGVFRRNSVVWSGDPSPNLNGGLNRNPTAIDRTGIRTFSSVATLAVDLSASATTAQIATATGIQLPITPATPVLIQIGDELLTYQSVTLGSPPTLANLARGQNGTRAEAHKAGTQIRVISGRPDGLFSDQIAKSDILDLRHLVNPNGFDYSALLRTNLDKLLKGQLRANWKRTGAGPQGPFVAYQDKITAGAVALGVTKLDGPDNLRMIFSDAATAQRATCIVKPTTGAIPGLISASWDLAINALQTVQGTSGEFNPADVFSIPVAQLKAGLPGGDADQVRWVNDGVSGAVTLRIDGQTDPLPASTYTVSPANPTSSDDLVITLGAGFPLHITKQIYISLHVMYGPGRGISRRPDSLHSVDFVNPSTRLLVRPSGVPSNNLPTQPSRLPLWSRYRRSPYKGLLPVTTDAYADLGSKTLALTPFQSIAWPTEFRTIDGTAANPSTTLTASGADGASDGTADFASATPGFNWAAAGANVGDALLLLNGPQPGRYTIRTLAPGGATAKITLDRAVPTTTAPISWEVRSAQGLMPLNTAAGVAKWTTTDPLHLFSSTTDPTASTKNIYVTLPRELVPGWGAFYVPILASDSVTFAEGVNFMTLSSKGAAHTDVEKNYIPYINGGFSYTIFSTLNPTPPGTPAPYNEQFSYGGKTYAGIRFFTDARGLGRQGLELPPFYGISRLFAVYEVTDYVTNGSAYDPSTRQPIAGRATNLLRQNMGPQDGPTFWIELDADGDSTFILNANAIDISRSPTPIASFASGNYVIEANIFGFDRGSFDPQHEFRMVLCNQRSQAVSGTRTNNLGAILDGPISVLPGPVPAADQVVINYSRTPYQGDAWGSQTSYIDLPYTPGPLVSGTAYQIVSTRLNESALTRPKPKALEVLASVGFTTTLGTGRLSGDVDITKPLDLREVGYENPAAYPPASSIADRPVTLPASFVPADAVEVGTEYLGCTERLPLGSLFRDKDFRGQLFGGATLSPFTYLDGMSISPAASLAVNSQLEQKEVLLDTSNMGAGIPGDALVYVDGEQGNYSLIVNYRTNRGGSVFMANGSHPGGEVALYHPAVAAAGGHTNILQGRAFLVRNAVTTDGSTEVSSGGELMLLVVTTVQHLDDSNLHAGAILIGTNGAGEGYSAADLYRIEGHPLLGDNVHLIVDTSIPLSKRGT